MDLRYWQSFLKDKVTEYLKNGFLVSLQAPTGSGKTLFSILVSFQVKPKVLYVVRTHNEFYPVYREIRKLNKTYSFIIGKSSACPFVSGDVDPEDIKCSSCEIYNSAKITVDESPFAFIKKIKKDGVEKGYCPYYSLLGSIEDSDLVLITYPYLFLPYLRESLDINIEDFAVIIDEAHNLDYLNDLQERKLNQNIIQLAKNKVKNSEVIKILDKLEVEIRKSVFSDDKYILMDNYPKLTEDELDILKDEYELEREEAVKQKKISRIYLGNILKFYTSLSEAKVFSYKGSLVSKPLTSRDMLSILNANTSFILMSGTLPPIEYMKKIMGIERRMIYIDVEKEVKSKITGNYTCMIATDVTSSYSLRTTEMWKKYASYILKIYHLAEKHILAVFPSYMIMEKIMNLIEVRKFVEKDKTNIEEIMEKTKQGKTIIAGVARGKLTEGVELTMEGKSLISDVILAGIPYPSVDDFLKLKAEQIRKITGENLIDLLISVPAYISVKQAIGRAIRSPEDKANVWLLDKRFDNIMWKTKLRCYNPRKVKL
ncbi:helicase C-terminal domain-containing protein [Acidianus brierleyi]|uniref:DEAD/DEAH box helicase n=1 Tax=Acidianus brierleyi TaxID=41673 RepID=A0A2U9IFM6_9CREN|nr:ATP-dependent DNA helicase [Acidianus brierleyi]AWR94841.1 DEAD/DEAH box helicase [Acidianus brierleyi]